MELKKLLKEQGISVKKHKATEGEILEFSNKEDKIIEIKLFQNRYFYKGDLIANSDRVSINEIATKIIQIFH